MISASQTIEIQGVLRGRAVSLSQTMNSSKIHDSILSRRSTPNLSATHPSDTVVKPKSHGRTISRTSVSSNHLSSFPPDLQEWALTLLEFADELEANAEPDEIFKPPPRYRPKETPRGRHDSTQIRSWATDSAGSLPYLNDGASVQPLTISMPRLNSAGLKQQHRNATVFSPPKASLDTLRASSFNGTDTGQSLAGSSANTFRQSSCHTLISGTSGGYRPEPLAVRNRREPPHHNVRTFRILEGREEFVLDARDISSGQLRSRPSTSHDGSLFDRRRDLQSILVNRERSESFAGAPSTVWTSTNFNQMENDIMSILSGMEGESPADREEDRPPPPVRTQTSATIRLVGDNMNATEQEDEDRSSILADQLPPPPPPVAPVIVPTAAAVHKERFGRLGRWLKKKVLRKNGATR